MGYFCARSGSVLGQYPYRSSISSSFSLGHLYIALGCVELGAFSKGKEASACIGLTPI
jgi:hypothetical protein